MAEATLFREAGEALYGPRWYTDLARALDVSERTVRRWDAGTFEIPAGAWRDLRALIRERGAALAAVRRKIPR